LCKSAVNLERFAMTTLAGVAFIAGLGAAFRLKLTAFAILALAVVIAAALLSAAGFAFGLGIGWAMLIAGASIQLGYVAGIALRIVIGPFPASRANKRGAAGAAA
jgi:hypothetical protein